MATFDDYKTQGILPSVKQSAREESKQLPDIEFNVTKDDVVNNNQDSVQT